MNITMTTSLLIRAMFYIKIYIYLCTLLCVYITITILLWVLSIYPFIKHYTIVILCQPYYLVTRFPFSLDKHNVPLMWQVSIWPNTMFRWGRQTKGRKLVQHWVNLTAMVLFHKSAHIAEVPPLTSKVSIRNSGIAASVRCIIGKGTLSYMWPALSQNILINEFSGLYDNRD